MRRWLMSLLVALTLASAQPVLAAQPEQGVVRTLVDASGTTCNNPEGTEASASGLLYTAGLSGNVCVYTLSGDLVRVIHIETGRALLGLMFDRAGKTLYIADNAGNFSSGRVDALDVASGTFSVLAGGFANTNAITLDHHGSLYVSDSFAGSITKIDPTTGAKTTWQKTNALLVPAGTPPFGANGVAFDRTESFLYVANTSTDRVMRIAVNADGTAGAISIFADGTTIDATTGTTHALDGADGIQFDVTGNLYVCANQANEIQVLSPGGALIARYGHNSGDDPMDFPASPIFHERGLYIANLALGTPGGGKVSVLGVPFPGAPIAH